MKIENNGINSLSTKPTDNAHPVEKKTQTSDSASVSAAKDKATLSERAKALAKARAALEETPEVRSDRVDALKEKIDSGNYQVNFEALASKLMKYLGIK